MDSVRIQWDAEHDTYVLHVPGQKDMVLTIQDLEDIQDALKRTFAEITA